MALQWASQEQILVDYPQHQPDDFLAVYAYAAELAGRTSNLHGDLLSGH